MFPCTCNFKFCTRKAGNKSEREIILHAEVEQNIVEFLFNEIKYI